jgi:hypothetical protein
MKEPQWVRLQLLPEVSNFQSDMLRFLSDAAIHGAIDVFLYVFIFHDVSSWIYDSSEFK